MGGILKKLLNELKTPAMYYRDPVKRKLVEALRGETVKVAIGDLWPKCEIFGYTKGQFSCINVIEHCLKQTGPADVFIATWSASAGDIKAAHNFLQSGRIRTLKFLVDYSFKSRKPEFCDELVATFGYDAIRVSVTHAKFIMVRNEKWDLVIRTSMNLNFNPRFENFEISDDKAFADFQQKIIDEIWSGQELAEGFKVRPQDNKEKFRKTFRDQGAIFGQDLADGRDLL